MQVHIIKHPCYRYCAALMLAVLAAGQTVPAVAQSRVEKQKRYQADRQACLSGNTSQVLDSCLKEARAALQEKAGSEPERTAEELQRNSLRRCDALPGDEAAACVARMRGQGSVRGSVAAGGVLRELVTEEKAAPPSVKAQVTE